MLKSNRVNTTSEWQRFFDGHAPFYMDNVFTKNTIKEVDFLLKELNLPKGNHILDIGCGTGRHSIELAKRGYHVTGIDLSSGMLSQAEETARDAKVKVEWIQADATRFKSDKLFDAAICLCEGAFGLLGKKDDSENHDLLILRNINVSLKPRAKLILTALNACAMIRRYSPEDVRKGKFDTHTLVEIHPMEYETSGGKSSVMLREKGFTAPELTLLFQQAGFKVEQVWGGTASKWGKRKLDLDEMEIMMIGRKLG
jgi:cyclopropane fatty-acyl-phospholipid synthase-like methyltransferase